MPLNPSLELENMSISYGHVWTNPAHELERIYHSCVNPAEALCAALSLGYFSQYTCYTNASLVARITDWEIDLLTHSFGDFLAEFPPDFEEKAHVPSATLIRWNGRSVTPDLLRNVWYALQIRSLIGDKLPLTRSRVLEIGSGSGSFARVYKDLNPNAQVWLTDLPESLRFAEIYLRISFPNACILFAEDASLFNTDLSRFDFILVPLSHKDSLVGRQFDLALNIWSFGEMPNHFIQEWFDLIQSRCQVRFIFTINAFLAPVTVDSVERANQGDWLLLFDKNWNVQHFKVNPEIHRNPFIKNFYCGLCILAERIDSEIECREQMETVKSGLLDVLLEDWACVLLHKNSNMARPETQLAEAFDNFPVNPCYFLAQLLAATEYIGRFNIDEGTSGTLCKLWSGFRVTGLSFAGELLACYIAMVAKTLPAYRCSKEELQILGRLEDSALRLEYKAFFSRLGEVAAQEACDKAIAYFQQGRIEEASAAFADICHKAPRHGDAWYFQALCQEKLNHVLLGSVCAKVALFLAPGVSHYKEHFHRMANIARKKHRLHFALLSLVRCLGPSFYAGALAARIDGLLSRSETKNSLILCSVALIREESLPSSLIRAMAKTLEKSNQDRLEAAFRSLAVGGY